MSRLDTAQVEQLEEIGIYLKAIREKQGKSLEEIATKTFIPLRLLKAIEVGNAQPLPEAVFIQGFIRRYAEALGLNGMDLSQRFAVATMPVPPSFAEPPTAPVDPALALRPPTSPSIAPTAPVAPSAVTPSPVTPSPVTLPATPPTGSPLPRGQVLEPTIESAQRPNWIPAYVVGGLVVLIGLGYAIAGQFRSPTEAPAFPEASTEPDLPRQPPPGTSETPAIATAPITSPSPVVSPSPQLAPAAGPVAVNVNFQGTSWIEVTIDGQVAFEGTLEAGTQRTWSGQEQVTIVAGNAGAVLVSYNQGQATPMGGAGEVQERSFPPVSTAQTPQNED